MERKTIIIIGVSVAVLIVTGAIVAIVLLLQKKDDDPDTTTPANSSSANGGQNGSTGGGANEDSTASQDLETWNENWTMEWDEEDSKYLFTQFSKADLGDNVDDAREMCLQYAHDINDKNPVCGISFYPLAYGTPEEKSMFGRPTIENINHREFPCNIFSDCTSNYPSVIKSRKGSQTLFTNTGLLCERGIGSLLGDWQETILNDDNDISWNVLNSIYLNKLSSDDDDNAVIKISRETLLPNGTSKKISQIRGDCLTRASNIDKVCGVNFYPRAFVTTTGEDHHNGNLKNDALNGIQGNDGWDETTYLPNSNNFLSEENYDNPCQIFVDCDSNPGYEPYPNVELGTAEGEGGEALFSRPFIRCMNNNEGNFFDD